MIIETSDNCFYRVIETNIADLAHVWYGIPVKKVKGQYVHTSLATKMLLESKPLALVRKAASRVVEA